MVSGIGLWVCVVSATSVRYGTIMLSSSEPPAGSNGSFAALSLLRKAAVRVLYQISMFTKNSASVLVATSPDFEPIRWLTGWCIKIELGCPGYWPAKATWLVPGDH